MSCEKVGVFFSLVQADKLTTEALSHCLNIILERIFSRTCYLYQDDFKRSKIAVLLRRVAYEIDDPYLNLR